MQQPVASICTGSQSRSASWLRNEMYLWAIILPERARGSTRAAPCSTYLNMTRPELQTLDVKPGTAGHPR